MWRTPDHKIWAPHAVRDPTAGARHLEQCETAPGRCQVRPAGHDNQPLAKMTLFSEQFLLALEVFGPTVGPEVVWIVAHLSHVSDSADDSDRRARTSGNASTLYGV